MDATLQKLKEQPLFKIDTLTGDDLEAIREMLSVATYKAGEVVFHQGDEATYFYMVTKGKFHLSFVDEAGENRALNLVYPHEFFGDVSLYNDEPRGVTVRAETDAEALLLHRDDFLAMLEDYPEVAQKLDAHGQEIEERTHAHFEGQRDGEMVLAYERRHWIVLVQRFLLIGLFLLLWGVAMFAAAFFLREEVAMQERVVIVGLGVLLLPAVALIWQIVDWWNDIYIVTNERVIHIEKVIGLTNERYEAPLTKIQDVMVAHPTPIGEMLGYGELIISTAAAKGAMELDHLPHADEVAEKIIHELNQEKGSMAQQEKEGKRLALRRALGFEPPAPAPAGGAAAAAAAAAPARPSPLARFIHYIRPIMREQKGSMITWRKHWIILLLDSALAYFALGFLLVFLLFVGLQLELEPRYQTATWILGGILLLLNIGWLLWIYADWRNDVYILTPEAILDEEQLPFGFQKEVRRAPLETIQDIQFMQNNPLMVWFGVGNVQIQTAGQQGRFTFDWVQDPRRVQDDIFRYIQQKQAQRERHGAELINQELLELLRMYEEERNKEAAKTVPPPPPTLVTPDPNDPDATRPMRSE